MFCARKVDAEGWPGSVFTCAAFPEGVPDSIVMSQVDHRQQVDGDHELRFEPVDADASAYAESLFPTQLGHCSPGSPTTDR